MRNAHAMFFGDGLPRFPCIELIKYPPAGFFGEPRERMVIAIKHCAVGILMGDVFFLGDVHEIFGAIVTLNAIDVSNNQSFRNTPMESLRNSPVDGYAAKLPADP